jgi:cytochrome b6-f complex iron-sulfur subunit
MNSPTHTRIEDDDPRSRRGFLAALGGLSLVWLGALVYPIYRYLSPQAAVDPFAKTGKTKVEKVSASDVARPGQGKNGGYAGRGLIVLRAGDGRLRAFDAKCTHAGCNVGFVGDRIVCPCHGGVYDLSGKNVSGPPPKPLTELTVFEENGEIFVGRPSSPVRS